MIESRALACKTEKQRIEVLQKSRERAAKKLKDAMLEAVLNGVIPIRVVIRLLS